MANRRMFSKEVTEQDAFAEMPHSTQLLYFHLGMNADDDGFLDNYNGIMRRHGFKLDDLKLLIAKGFVIGFETCVVVIRHWNINNQLRKDRHHPTKYLQELQQLQVLSNGEYALLNAGCQVGNQMATEYSIAKDSIVENSINKTDKISADSSTQIFIPSIGEIKAYCIEQGIEIDIERFYNYYASRGWHINGEPVQSWTGLVRGWHARNVKYKGEQTTPPITNSDDGNGGTVL